MGLALGLGAARPKGGLASDTSTYLRTHARLLEEQMVDLKRNEVSDVLSIVLQVFSVIVGLTIAGFFVVAVWQAAHSRTLVIEPISVPEDMEKSGLTPSVLSAQLLDKLRAMQAGTDSARAPGTYSSNWSEDIEIDIPQTGVSVGEALRVLRRWLGKDIHITGETWKLGQGLALNARVGTDPAQTFKSETGDLDALMRQAAESVYAKTQPYRYSVFLWQNDKQREAIAVLRNLANDKSQPDDDRAWAFIGLGGMQGAMGDLKRAASSARQGLRLNPHLASGWKIVADTEYSMGRDEAMLAAYRSLVRSVARDDGGGITAAAGAQNGIDAEASIAEALGDWRTAAVTLARAGSLQDYQSSAATASVQGSLYRIMAHEPVNPWSLPLDPEDDEAPVSRARLVAVSAAANDSWQGVGDALERIQAEANREPGIAYRAQLWPTQVWPWQAYAYARAGRTAEARRLIGRTPLDCYICVRMRARIEDVAGNRAAANAWFAGAVKIGPSLPFAYGEWGQSLAGWGQHAAAEKQFKAAIDKGEAWAEPHLWWGHSLWRRGRREEAVARFRRAAELAPGWRLPRRLAAEAAA